MRYFPIYLKLSSKHVVVSGAGHTAVLKLRLLLKTDARISVFGANPHADIQNWADTGDISLFERQVEKEDIRDALLLYCANNDSAEDARVAEIARSFDVIYNIAENLEDSAFITPAIVDRDPVTVAIGTEGTAPVLARNIKADLEERLPQRIGLLARVGKAYRSQVNKRLDGKIRRDFWSEFYSKFGPRGLSENAEAHALETLQNLFESYLSGSEPSGLVSIVGAGPGDPELLTLKARNRLQDADVVVYDSLIPTQILEIARREAVIIRVGKTGDRPSLKQAHINRTMIEHAKAGRHVVRLKSGDPAIFGRLDEELGALDTAGIDWEIVSGITAAIAAAAGLNVSMTQRGRNSEMRIVTGHDAHGFAELDWSGLAKFGAVAAIYMGKRAARFLQGRLLMHGASGSTPVTVVENASLPEQKIVSTTLHHLSDVVREGQFSGPTIIFLGLSKRCVANAAESLPT